MNRLTVLAFACVSLAACAVEPYESDGAPGLRPGYKPSLSSTLPNELAGGQSSPEGDRPNIAEDRQLGRIRGVDGLADSGRVEWVETVDEGDVSITKLHHVDLATGIDSIDILSDDGTVVASIVTRYHDPELPADARR